nr:LysR family transcriptional regulator [Kibdelosporangium sp. MJ126-NF4]CEL23047.1 probable transcriptional regulator [Kibdelosporangium sp. MJ126-NF4]CTQ90185.1 probable transcriptional regulator [Kibdelosporangium sp. MJ126-NF4]
MDLGPQHLRMIDAIATAGSISKAAAQLDLTQPSVSTMLNRVERHLGIRLFNRSSDGVSLTPVGTEVVSRSRAILAGVDDLYATLRGPAADEAGPVLRIGGQLAPALISLSAQFATVFPRVRTQLRTDSGTSRILSLLASGALEIAVVHEPVTEPVFVPANVERHVLVNVEPEFVGLASDSPLARQADVTLADLADLQWIDDPMDDGPWPAFFRRRCAEAGFLPTVSFWTGSWEFATSLIRSGQGVAIYHPTARPREGVVFRQLRDDPLTHRVVLLWRRESRATALRLRTELGRIYRRLVSGNPMYAKWWNEHPEAHPTLPPVGNGQVW